MSRVREGIEALVDALMHLPREMAGNRLEQAFHAVDVAIDRSARHSRLLREVEDVHL
ncbi:hypothetical protein D3C73_1522680 [compost metagenome]